MIINRRVFSTFMVISIHMILQNLPIASTNQIRKHSAKFLKNEKNITKQVPSDGNDYPVNPYVFSAEDYKIIQNSENSNNVSLMVSYEPQKINSKSTDNKILNKPSLNGQAAQRDSTSELNGRAQASDQIERKTKYQRYDTVRKLTSSTTQYPLTVHVYTPTTKKTVVRTPSPVRFNLKKNYITPQTVLHDSTAPLTILNENNLVIDHRPDATYSSVTTKYNAPHHNSSKSQKDLFISSSLPYSNVLINNKPLVTPLKPNKRKWIEHPTQTSFLDEKTTYSNDLIDPTETNVKKLYQPTVETFSSTTTSQKPLVAVITSTTENYLKNIIPLKTTTPASKKSRGFAYYASPDSIFQIQGSTYNKQPKNNDNRQVNDTSKSKNWNATRADHRNINDLIIHSDDDHYKELDSSSEIDRSFDNEISDLSGEKNSAELLDPVSSESLKEEKEIDFESGGNAIDVPTTEKIVVGDNQAEGQSVKDDVAKVNDLTEKTGDLAEEADEHHEHEHHAKEEPKEEEGEESHSKEHLEAHHEREGDKGEKGYKEIHEHDSSEKGHHDKESHDKEYDEKDGKKKDHHGEAGFHAQHEEAAKGEKKSSYTEKGKHNKGHSTKGEHVVHKKNEFDKKTEFFDEFNEDGETGKSGSHRRKYERKKGGHFKKSRKKGKSDKKSKGKREHREKGHHHRTKKGHHKKKGHKKHHDRHESHGKKTAHKNAKEWKHKN